MKRLSLKWLVGTDVNGDPVFKRQTLNVEDTIDVAKALVVAQTLEKYTTYSVDTAQVITYEAVI
ncbi:DUF1659 domain-containing protein [Thermosipho atlanticus]|uniref:DUF1659 domain-containing protein n=1 Tax=Thermosipho atlanticus DSM 15807 TaxID=1123380 RepID=A0A1M5RLQ2_9BACT|nr:DUF1659 domain-containing protein [Thermosipho atlanticus]SHH26773.1 Protein of unknown function [Thermosipho atlanticus DSM 15807]